MWVTYFFSNRAHYISFGALSLVENIHNIKKYDWATTILARVYYELDAVVATPSWNKQKVSIVFGNSLRYANILACIITFNIFSPKSFNITYY